MAPTWRVRLIGRQDVSMGAVKVTSGQRVSIRGPVPLHSAAIKTLSVGHLMLLTDEEEHEATGSNPNHQDGLHSLLQLCPKIYNKKKKEYRSCDCHSEIESAEFIFFSSKNQ